MSGPLHAFCPTCVPPYTPPPVNALCGAVVTAERYDSAPHCPACEALYEDPCTVCGARP